MESTRTPLEMVSKLTGGPHPTKSAARPPAVCAWQAAAAGGLSAQPCPMSPYSRPQSWAALNLCPLGPGLCRYVERVFTDVFEAKIETRPSWITVGPKTHDTCPKRMGDKHWGGVTTRQGPLGRSRWKRSAERWTELCLSLLLSVQAEDPGRDAPRDGSLGGARAARPRHFMPPRSLGRYWVPGTDLSCF